MLKLLIFLLKTRFSKQYLTIYLIFTFLIVIFVRFLNIEYQTIYVVLIFSALLSLQLSKSDLDYLLTSPIPISRLYFSIFLTNMFGTSLLSLFLYILSRDTLLSLIYSISFSSLSTLSFYLSEIQLPFKFFISSLIALLFYLNKIYLIILSIVLLISMIILSKKIQVYHLMPFSLSKSEGKSKIKFKGKYLSIFQFHFFTFSILLTLSTLGSPSSLKARVKLYQLILLSTLFSLLLAIFPKSPIIGYLTVTSPLMFVTGFFLTSLLGEERLWLGFGIPWYFRVSVIARMLALSLILLPLSLALILKGLMSYGLCLIPLNLIAMLLYLRVMPYSFVNLQEIFAGNQPMYVSLRSVIYPLIITFLIAIYSLQLYIDNIIIIIIPYILLIIISFLLLRDSAISSMITKLSLMGYT